jgi:hypothetical protein
MQNSLLGLYRSLLHDVLTVRPELIPRVFPELWEQVKLVPWQIQTEFPLSMEDIRIAFTHLIKTPDIYDDICFCFFIDGLDEYIGTHEEDQKYLTQLLCDWTASASKSVKICVSSREYNVFLNAFSSKQRIRLQDLTWSDMERYVKDNLAYVEDSLGIETVMQNTVRKANGIFLWLALAVKTIRRRLEDAHTVAEIEKELDSLPLELVDLLQHVFNMIKESSPKRAYLVFMTMKRLEPYEIGFSLLHYSFLDEYERDPEFAIKKSFPCSSIENDYRQKKLDLALRKLNGDCRGLVEPKAGDQSEFSLDVIFTHRSIPEFLYQPEIQSEMELYLKFLCLEVVLSQLLLGEIRSRSTMDHIKSSRANLLLYATIHMRSHIKADQTYYRFRQRLDSVLGEDDHPCPKRCQDFYHAIFTKKSAGFKLGYYFRKPYLLCTPLQISMFMGDKDYVVWKMLKNPGISYNLRTWCYLAWAIRGALYDDRIGCFYILKLLLKDSLNPNACIFTKSSTLFDGKGAGLTLWQTFIGYAAFYCKPKDHRHKTQRIFGEVLRMFLEQDVDTHLWVSVELRNATVKIDEESDQDSLMEDDCDSLMNDDDGSIVSHSSDTGQVTPYQMLIFGKEGHRIAHGFYRDFSPVYLLRHKGGELSLRDMIKYWELDNTVTLLELLDKKAKKEGLAISQDGTPQNRIIHNQVNRDLGYAQFESENEQQTAAGTLSEEERSPKLAQNPSLTAYSVWIQSRERERLLIFLLGENAP